MVWLLLVVAVFLLLGFLAAYTVLKKREKASGDVQVYPQRGIGYISPKKEKEVIERMDTEWGMGFLEAAKRRAERQGKTTEQVLEELISAEPTYPTSDCLLPTELVDANFKFANLSKDRQDHVLGCEFCAGLLADPETPQSPPPQ